MILVLLSVVHGHSGINIGDIVYQLLAFLVLLAIPVGIIILIVVLKRRNSRMKQLEEKLDRLLEEKEQRNKGE